MNEKPIILSERMKAITTMVTPGNRVCDIGCDHGYISIFLVQQKISPNVIACDINKGPLSRAQENIEAYCLEQYIETRLSDGLNALAMKEADTMICAGMGGKVMQHILVEGHQNAKSFQELILQPQSEIKQFREFLRKGGMSPSLPLSRSFPLSPSLFSSSPPPPLFSTVQ